MSRLRDDIRTAFEREQASLGEVGDARHRLMHGAMVNRDVPASRGWQWAAGVAAILIAAIVITTFALVKANTHGPIVPVATPSPRSVASPTPLANQINVPDSTPLILYHDPANFDQLDGVTWDGQTSGKLGDGTTLGGIGNPQGTLFTTSAGELKNRSGAVLAPKGFDGAFFADDGIHFCTLIRSRSTDTAVPGVLWIGALGQSNRRVVQVGTFGAPTSNAGGPVVVACSPGSDRTVVYQAAGQGVGVTEFWVIQLSTGRTLWHGGSGAWIAASHDGRYVALSPAPGQPTRIYGPSGAVVGATPDEVFAFSWDDTLAVAAGSFGALPKIIDWRNGQTVWTCPNATSQYWQAFSEPGGSRIAIGAADPSYKNTTGFQPVDLFVIGADGTVVFERKDLTLFQY